MTNSFAEALANNYLIALNAFANVAITLGYAALAFFIVPRITVHLSRTRIGGIGFFFTCGLTHLHLAYELIAPHPLTTADLVLSLIIHVPQAIFIVMFVSGLYLEFVRWGPWSSNADPDRDHDPLFDTDTTGTSPDAK